MRWFYKLSLRLRSLFRKSHVERELSEELRFHLEKLIEEKVAKGVKREQARDASLRELGGLDQIKEECRDMRRVSYIESFIQDVRYGLRLLLHNASFTAVAVATLALGIGANTAIFSVAAAALLRPLPYRDSGRLVVIWNQLHRLGLEQFPASFADYYDYGSSNRVFEDIAAFQPTHLDLAGGDQPERVYGIRASANLFPLLGVNAERGRTLLGEENQPGRRSVVLLSDALWKRRYGGDPGVLGRTTVLDGEACTVVGILPPDFRFSLGGSLAPDVWLPLVLRPDPERQMGGLELVARLKREIPLEEAQASMKALAAALEQRYHLYRGPHGEDAGYDVSVIPMRQQVFGSLREGLLILLGAVGFVLLIACANVANLLLARGNGRRREIAMRAALGASQNRLMRQLLTEGLLLALFGAAVGMVLARWSIKLLVSLSPQDAMHLLALRLDGSVLAFAAGLAVLTALVFGFVPAWHFSKADLNAALRESGWSAGSASRHLLSSFLVVAEVALSLMLLASAGLLIRSLGLLEEVNPGFRPENILTARISLPATQYRDDARVENFYSQLLERVRALPGVQSASLISALPLSGAATRDPFSIEGRPWQPHGASGIPQVADFQAVGAGYFRAMGIPLLKGRDFSDHDTKDAPPAAIVNQTLVRGFWPDRDPIGQHIMLGAPRPGVPWLTIVGVASDVRTAGLESAPIPQIYVLQQQHPVRSMLLVMRISPGAPDPIAGVRNITQTLDPSRPIYGVATMGDILMQSIASRRYTATLLGFFAFLAVVLAAIGIYGVISYSVAQRTQEMGVRMALGAQRAAVLLLVVGQGFRLTLMGVGIGILGALALTRLLGSLLYGLKPTDPITYVAVSLILSAVALLASYIPAQRAAKVDPMVALRYE
jgi:putative ABC transport system permease protein